MSGDRVGTHFQDYKVFADLLKRAEAKKPEGREGVFVAGLRDNYSKYGQGMFLSHKQLRWLQKIAGDENGNQ